MLWLFINMHNIHLSLAGENVCGRSLGPVLPAIGKKRAGKVLPLR